MQDGCQSQLHSHLSVSDIHFVGGIALAMIVWVAIRQRSDIEYCPWEPGIYKRTIVVARSFTTIFTLYETQGIALVELGHQIGQTLPFSTGIARHIGQLPGLLRSLDADAI